MDHETFNCSLKWYSKDVAKNFAHVRHLSFAESKAILQILTQLEDSNLSFNNDYMKCFLREKFQSLCDEILYALVHSRGFITIKGFPAHGDGHDPELIKKLFIAFCLLLGTPLVQNKNRDIIFDVKSVEGMTLGARNSRGPYVKESLPMHTDAGAILGMYCIAASNVGGHTLLTSSRTVHDEIKKIRPDLLNVLYQPFYTDRRGNEPEGSLPYDFSPVFVMYGDQLRCQYHQPFYLDAQKKFSDIPRLTSQQLEALILFDQIALQENIAFETRLEPGSIIFINNEEILHGRTTFDYPENTTVRHLLRIWLNTPTIKHTFPNFLGHIN